MSYLKAIWSNITLYAIMVLSALVAFFRFTAKRNKKKLDAERVKRESAERSRTVADTRRETAASGRLRDERERGKARAGDRSGLGEKW